jgi:hypothetical protein
LWRPQPSSASGREDSLRSHRVIGPRADDIVDYQIEGVRLNAAGGERASARISNSF